jgi:hypothetical protein
MASPWQLYDQFAAQCGEPFMQAVEDHLAAGLGIHDAVGRAAVDVGAEPATLRQAEVFADLARVHPGAPGAGPVSTNHDYPRAWPPGVDEDRQQLHERVEAYARAHGLDYAAAFAAIAADEDRF